MPRVLAMTSGGKDSMLALHLASEQNRHVEGILTLIPEDPESPLYHTYNLHCLPQVAAALNLPSYQFPAPAGREEHALEDALRVTGCTTLITGGIASEFQRTRFGRVAQALGVEVLAPLWGWTADRLYAELLRRKIDAVIVAVAAHGLTADWLGRRLDAQTVERLQRLAQERRFEATGEGGDLDTLVLDAPLYRVRLEIEEAETCWLGDRGHYRVQRLRAVPKSTKTLNSDIPLS